MSLARKRLKDPGAHERPLKDAYLFILAGEHNAASLAAKLGVSLPTASRVVEGLKKHLARNGKRLVSVRWENGFHYEIRDDDRSRRLARDPLVTLTIRRPGGRGLKAEDRDIYEWD